MYKRQVLIGGPVNIKDNIANEQSKKGEWDRMSDLTRLVDNGENLSVIQKSVDDLAQEYKWSDEQKLSTLNDLTQSYYQRQINEFIDSNDELFLIPSGERVRMLRQFDSLISDAGDTIDKDESERLRTKYIRKIVSSSQRVINDLVTSKSQSQNKTALNKVYDQIRSFYKDLKYTPEKVEEKIKEATMLVPQNIPDRRDQRGS